jgi:hypothetical protein
MSAQLRGGFDFLGMLTGLPKAGKSSLLKDLAGAFLEAGGYALIHDQAHDWKLPVHVHAWDEFMALMGRRPRPRAVGFDGPWSELVKGVIELGRKVNAQTEVTFPMFVGADETSGIDSSGRTHLGADDSVLLTQRRHLGVAIGLNLQRVSNLPETAWGLVTDLFAFRMVAHDVETLEARIDSPGLLAGAVSLPQGEYLHCELGFEKRIVDEKLWTPGAR